MENLETEVKEVELTLEELYNGKEINYPTQVESSCFKCGGKGQVMQSFTYSREADCNLCNGKGKKVIAKTLKVRIPPGGPEFFPHSTTPYRLSWTFGFSGRNSGPPGSDVGHEKLLKGVGWPPRDVILRVKQKMHPFLNRRGTDLFMCMQVTMAEALCGFQKVFTTLDGRELIISSPKGSVVSPNSVKCIENEGFPMLDKPRFRGKLFIKFLVTYPILSPDTAKMVAEAIQGDQPCEEPDSDADEVRCKTLSPKSGST